MSRCLCCGKLLRTETEHEWHASCIKSFFGTKKLPDIDVSKEVLHQIVIDSTNKGYWYQLEFMHEGEWLRAYTPANRIDVADASLIPEEVRIEEPLDVRESLLEYPCYYGPGEHYKQLGVLGKGKRCPVYNIENGWIQVEYFNYGDNTKYRGWVPLHVIYGQ